jgi:beta-galactosidase/beta-glucuronidase
VLDQGYWHDGIYTPSSPDKYAEDILAMKSLGYNTLRKHIKIEPEIFYYECDRLGMAVFQDMVNNSDYSFLMDSVLPMAGRNKVDDKNLHDDPESRMIFLESMEGTVKALYNHPSICYWTIFNEGWGQFNADEAYDRLKELDSSRFIDSTSGWFWQNKSDVDSYHVYFKKVDLTPGDRPLVLSEFGGYACKLPGYYYGGRRDYGYRKCPDRATLQKDISRLYKEEIKPLLAKGLSAAIYTQLSDVEDETNGLLTYDREIKKIEKI